MHEFPIFLWLTCWGFRKFSSFCRRAFANLGARALIMVRWTWQKSVRPRANGDTLPYIRPYQRTRTRTTRLWRWFRIYYPATLTCLLHADHHLRNVGFSHSTRFGLRSVYSICSPFNRPLSNATPCASVHVICVPLRRDTFLKHGSGIERRLGLQYPRRFIQNRFDKTNVASRVESSGHFACVR